MPLGNRMTPAQWQQWLQQVGAPSSSTARQNAGMPQVQAGPQGFMPTSGGVSRIGGRPWIPDVPTRDPTESLPPPAFPGTTPTTAPELPPGLGGPGSYPGPMPGMGFGYGRSPYEAFGQVSSYPMIYDQGYRNIPHEAMPFYDIPPNMPHEAMPFYDTGDYARALAPYGDYTGGLPNYSGEYYGPRAPVGGGGFDFNVANPFPEFTDYTAPVPDFNAAGAGAYPGGMDFGGAGSLYSGINPWDFSVPTAGGTPGEVGVGAAPTAMTPYDYNLPANPFNAPSSANLWAGEFGAPQYDPATLSRLLGGTGLPSSGPGEPPVLPAQPITDTQGITDTRGVPPTVDPVTGQPYPQMPNIPIDPKTNLPWTWNPPGSQLTWRQQMALPTNWKDSPLGALGRFLGGIPGAIGNLINEPGYSSPSYLLGIGYQGGQGIGSLWPAEHGNLPGVRGGPLPGSFAGLGSGGSGFLGGSRWQKGFGDQLLRNWLRTGGSIGSPSVPNPQAQAFFGNALRSNPVLRAYGPIVNSQNVPLTPQLAATIQNYLTGGRGQGARGEPHPIEGGGRTRPQ